METPWGLPFLLQLPLPFPPLVRVCWAKKADTVVHLVCSVLQVIGTGKALAKDKNPLECTLFAMCEQQVHVMDNPTACKSQRLRQAGSGCPGQPRVNLPG